MRCSAVALARRLGLVLALLAGAGLSLAPAWAAGDAARGKKIFEAADCVACHTDSKNKGALLAGGRAFKTPFGIFFSPNITPDPVQGIGKWTEADFHRALREGKRPDGAYYFPVFPYTAFTGITDGDIADLWAYLQTIPPAATVNRPHEIKFPFQFRFLQLGWRLLNFREGPFRPDPHHSAEWNRGAYLTGPLGHCGECHTPRDIIGGLRQKYAFSGSGSGPDGGKVPNITPNPTNGIGKWSADDLQSLLSSGMTPDGDFVGDGMAEVVENSTSKLPDDDIAAIIAYLKSLPPRTTPK